MAKKKKRRTRRAGEFCELDRPPAPRLWLVRAFRYVPKYQLFDMDGTVLGLLEQEPVEYVWEGRPPYEEDGSVYMTPKQAGKMVERSDYRNYLHYALSCEAPPDRPLGTRLADMASGA
jgi:hypothetical protein